MAVYVDSPIYKLGRMKMCHMLADTGPELHRMASLIGVARRHYQYQASTPHYDICKSKREMALKLGAVEVRSRRELVVIIKRLRNQTAPRTDGCYLADR